MFTSVSLGNDNGQLSLTTNSLSASSLNTTTNNKSNSIGLNAGGNANTNSAKLNRVSLDYTNYLLDGRGYHA
jgi:hypothetical protein